MSEHEPLAEEPQSATEAPHDEAPTGDAPKAAPPEDEWPTHGGYLGCLLAVMFGCLLAGFFASPLVQGAYRSGHGAGVGYGPVLNIAAIIIMVIGLIIFGRIGWWVGKRIYREYPASTRRRTMPTEQTQTIGEIGDEQHV